jgi:hypothetical protein
MKSSPSELSSRGFIADGVEQNYQHLSFSERVNFLQSKTPTDRTLGARLLGLRADLSAINYLTDALKVEKKLYTKMEICTQLESFGIDAVKPLISLLGKVGNNQYKQIPEEKFRKKNYPLPHDIAARTLGRMGTIALPELIKVLDSKDEASLSEAIDAIGYICFYNNQPHVFPHLEACFYRNINNDLIKWKIFRAMSACSESEEFLNEHLMAQNNALIRKEIERSSGAIRKSK